MEMSVDDAKKAHNYHEGKKVMKMELTLENVSQFPTIP